MQPGHPDPTAYTLRAIVPFLRKLVERNETKCTFGVFLDFCSLHQHDANGGRSTDEDVLFKAALQQMAQYYASPHTVTLGQTLLPEGYPDGFNFRPGSNPNTNSYYHRGWCFFEYSVSRLGRSRFLDVAKLADPERRLSVEDAVRQCAVLDPPLAPDDFAQQIAQKRFTAGVTDLEMVRAQYQSCFEGVMGEEVVLEYAGRGWGDTEAATLARALATGAAHACETLDLSHNAIGDAGLTSIAHVLRDGAMPAIRRVELDGNPASAAAKHAIQDTVSRVIDGRVQRET